MVEELAEGHQEQVGAERVRLADRVTVRIERLLADQVADQSRVREQGRPVRGGGADRIGARLRFCLLELRGRQTQEWLTSISPEFAAGGEVVLEPADVTVESRIVHLREKQVEIFRA